MTVATFLWFTGILSLVSTSEARLVRRKDPGTNPNSKTTFYSTVPDILYQMLSDDLEKGHLIEYSPKIQTQDRFCDELLRLLPKIPFEVMHPGTNDRIAYVGISKLSFGRKFFQIIRVSNHTRGHSEESFVLSFIGPTIVATFDVKQCPTHRGPSVPCTLQYVYEKIAFDLKVYWRNRKPYRVLRASISNAEPVSTRLQSYSGNTEHDNFVYQKGSPMWKLMVEDARLHIPANPQFGQLAKDLATMIVT